MQIVSLKIDGKVLKHIDNSLRSYNFSTRTEFIREAIRDKLTSLEKDDIIKQLLNYKDQKEFEKIAKRFAKEYSKKR